MHNEEEISRTEDIQTAEVLRRQTKVIRRLRRELDALQGKIGDAAGGGGPIAELLKIVADDKAHMRVRVEAASLVLAHNGPEAATKVAVAFLAATARRADVSAGDKLDALRALTRREVPKANPPTKVARSIDFASLLREARLRAEAKRQLGGTDIR
jgi:hypothetical protein